MAHFAKIRNSDNRVIEVIVVCNSEVSFNGDPAGEAYCQRIFKTDPNEYYWKQTSYNTFNNKHWTVNSENRKIESADQTKAFRGNYAGKGMFYDKTKDIFYVGKSDVGMKGWTFNDSKAAWEPPVNYPTTDVWTNGDFIFFKWDDATLGWTGKTDDGVEVRWDSATQAWIQ
jgi:hypothetical protein